MMRLKRGNSYQCIKTGKFKANDFNSYVVNAGTVLYCETDGILLLRDNREFPLQDIDKFVRIAISCDASEYFVKYELPDEIARWKEIRNQAAIAALPASLEWVGSLLKQGASAERGTVQAEVAAFSVRLADALVKELKDE